MFKEYEVSRTSNYGGSFSVEKDEFSKCMAVGSYLRNIFNVSIYTEGNKSTVLVSRVVTSVTTLINFTTC